ncbi:MAG: DMT family transporter [Paracoccaceae bacterium]
MTRLQATAMGGVAILLWSLLAVFTVGTAPVPPLQLNAMCFTLATMVGGVWLAWTGRWRDLPTVRWTVYVFGTAGLFGYHLFYFTALRLAPAAEAGLIAYLWPLLIVLFSGLLPGERLRLGHVAGGLIGFAGAALILLQDGAVFSAAALPGYGFAMLCALTWSGYSVMSRRLGQVPTSSVVVFCALTALLSGGAHLVLEQTAWPVGTPGWGSVLALGLGPVGVAFFTWDVGVKRGNIQMLGVASYAAPLLSTFALIAVGVAQANAVLLGAAALIAGGALVAGQASRGR